MSKDSLAKYYQKKHVQNLKKPVNDIKVSLKREK